MLRRISEPSKVCTPWKFHIIPENVPNPNLGSRMVSLCHPFSVAFTVKNFGGGHLFGADDFGGIFGALRHVRFFLAQKKVIVFSPHIGYVT